MYIVSVTSELVTVIRHLHVPWEMLSNSDYPHTSSVFIYLVAEALVHRALSCSLLMRCATYPFNGFVLSLEG